MSDLVRIKWVKKHSPYNIGEICGFPEAQAQKFVNSGHARFLDKQQTSGVRKKLDGGSKPEKPSGKSKGSKKSK